MTILRKSYWFISVVLIYGFPLPLLAQEAGQNRADSNTRQGRRIGAPQVLEIPVQGLPSSTSGLPPQEEVKEVMPPPSESGPGMGGSYNAGLPAELPPQLPPAQPYRRTYLGVLYATAEEGPVGVKVLSVVAGSPAARAGFQGADTPPAGGSSLFKAAIVVLAMSPAGPFAIPLAIAHDMYTNRHPPGDLIVAVNNEPVRDAQEFSDKLRYHQPGDTVVFSVIRGGEPVQVSVQLEEEPL